MAPLAMVHRRIHDSVGHSVADTGDTVGWEDMRGHMVDHMVGTAGVWAGTVVGMG